MSANLSQKQSNTTIYGLPPDNLKQYVVQPAKEEEIAVKKEKEKQEQDKEQDKSSAVAPPKRIDPSKLEDYSITKFFKQNNFDISKTFREIKLENSDPIGNLNLIFDAYYKDADTEFFIEVRPSRRFIISTFYDRIYVLLSRIYHYRSAKNSNTYLHLIVPLIEDEGSSTGMVNKLFDFFQPALNNGLLRISVLPITKSEAEKLFED